MTCIQPTLSGPRPTANLVPASSPCPQLATRPAGCPAYEALTDSERNQYVTAVLLPQVIVLWAIEDEGLEDDARTALLDEKSELGVTEAEVEARAWEMGYESVGRMSAARMVKATRDYRRLAVGGTDSDESDEDEREVGRSRRKRIKSLKSRGP